MKKEEVLDPAYWIINPLDSHSSDTLLRIEAKIQPFAQQDRRLDVAYLIARDCVKANFKTRTLTLTPKGQDACRFYAAMLKPKGA